MPIDYFGFAYAATVAGGGIFGYVKARKYSFTSHLFLKWVDVFLIISLDGSRKCHHFLPFTLFAW